MALPGGAQGASGRASRWGLYLPLAALLVVVLIWTGLWFVAAGAARRVAEGFVAREAQRGREWVCPAPRLSGYPFRVALECDEPRLLVRGAQGMEREATLARLTLQARVMAPRHFIALFAPPFRFRQGGEGEAELTWQSARASLIAGEGSIAEASLEVAEPRLLLGLGEAPDRASRARSLEVHLRATPGDKAGTDLVGKLVDLSVPGLDQLTSTPEPMQAELQATFPGLQLQPGRDLRASIESWRGTGERGRVVVLALRKGIARIDLAGDLGLDSERRPEGVLRGRAKGIESLTGRFSRRGGFDIGGLLGLVTGPDGFPVALTLSNGQARLGPLVLGRLDPLY